MYVPKMELAKTVSNLLQVASLFHTTWLHYNHGIHKRSFRFFLVWQIMQHSWLSWTQWHSEKVLQNWEAIYYRWKFSAWMPINQLLIGSIRFYTKAGYLVATPNAMTMWLWRCLQISQIMKEECYDCYVKHLCTRFDKNFSGNNHKYVHGGQY